MRGHSIFCRAAFSKSEARIKKTSGGWRHSQREWREMRIAGLDGLRALAILLVLGQHLQMGGWISHFQPNLGRLGVALFFALSGYLITGVLLDSHNSLLGFYWRRSLRIFPAFYAYWLTVLALALTGLQQVSPLAMAAAATYWINWLPAASVVVCPSHISQIQLVKLCLGLSKI